MKIIKTIQDTLKPADINSIKYTGIYSLHKFNSHMQEMPEKGVSGSKRSFPVKEVSVLGRCPENSTHFFMKNPEVLHFTLFYSILYTYYICPTKLRLG